MNRFHLSGSRPALSERRIRAAIPQWKARVYSTFTAILLAFAASAFGQSRTIVIDAGHGGFDRGGVPGQRISEKDKTLDVAQRLKRILQAEGYRVIMTRDSDVFIPLGTRVAI